jgi:hypothetical protein
MAQAQQSALRQGNERAPVQGRLDRQGLIAAGQARVTHLPATDHQHLAGDEGCAGEECRDVHDFLDRAGAAQRDRAGRRNFMGYSRIKSEKRGNSACHLEPAGQAERMGAENG